ALKADLHLGVLPLEIPVPGGVPGGAADGGDQHEIVAVPAEHQRRRSLLARLPPARRQHQDRDLQPRPAEPPAGRPVESGMGAAHHPQKQLLHRPASSLSAAWSAAAAGPRSNAWPSSPTTGITSRTDEVVNASSAASTSAS